MSEYIRVLERLQQAQHGAPPAASTVTPLAPQERAPSARTSAPTAETAADDDEAYRRLYDQIRLATIAAPKRAVVFVGASGQEPVAVVTSGLARYIERLGVRVTLAELALRDGRPILRLRREAPLESLSDLGLAFEGDLMPLDLSSAAALTDLQQWLAAASRTADVVIIEGRPLDASVDAALLARACDGLILVAQPGVTTRETLRAASEHAAASGCRSLGLVLYGTANAR